MKLLLLLLCICGISFKYARAIYCEKAGYKLGPSKYCFKAYQSYKTYREAKRRCEQDGALLSKTDDDFNFVRKLMNDQRKKANKGDILNGYWIGGWRDSRDRFRWLDNSRVDPPSGKNPHWVSGEPNDYWFSWEGEDCMMTYNGWRAWNDVRCSINIRFICQMDSVNPCRNRSPCQNGGICSSNGRTMNCACPPGFSGRRCQRDDRPCAKRPCENGGQCRNIQSGLVPQPRGLVKRQSGPRRRPPSTGRSVPFTFECKCPKEYEGVKCEKRVDPCAKIQCQNGGQCVAAGLKWSCTCPKLFTGALCETSLRPCELHPCKNGAICENVGQSYMCFCKPGFQGQDCEEEDDCKKAGHPCQNGAKCIGNASVKWFCAVVNNANDQRVLARTTDLSAAQKALGFGSSRQRQAIIPMIDHTAGDPHTLDKSWSTGSMWWWNWPDINVMRDLCTKADLPAIPQGAACECPKGYSGAGCETGPCSGDPCQNGGSCAEQNGDYFCECVDDFFGRNCQKECPKRTKDGFPEKLDIMFLLDGSASVGKWNYGKSLQFVDKVIQKVKLGKDYGRVGYIQYAGQWKRGPGGRIVYYDQIKTSSEITFDKSLSMTKEELQNKIKSDELFETYTRTGDALLYALARFHADNRTDVTKYLFVLTDGVSTGQSRMVKMVSDLIYQKGITAFAIGVGNAVSYKELDYIAHGDRNKRFHVGDFDKLNDQFIQTIEERQCYTGPCEKYQPCKNSGECIDYDDSYSCECPLGEWTGVHCEIDCKDVMIGGLPEKLDAVFLMDGSGSIDEADEFYNAKHLVGQVLMKMNIGPDKQRAAVMQFAGHRDESGEWQSVYNDKEISFLNSTEMGRLKVIDFVEKEAKWDGWTLTAGALQHVGDMIKAEGRPNVEKYLFVMTDGRITRGVEKMKEEAKRLKSLGVTSVAIAIGNDVDDETLAIIANGDNSKIFKASDFKTNSENFIEQIVEKRCDQIKAA